MFFSIGLIINKMDNRCNQSHQNRWNQKNEMTKILYRFQLQLDQVMLNVPLGCRLFIEWGRKNMKARSQCTLQKLQSMTQNLYSIKALERLVLDQKISTNNYVLTEERQNFIKIILQKSGVTKLGGSLKFNVNQAIKLNISQGITKFDCSLGNTPDAVSCIKFWIRYSKIQEAPNFYSSKGSFRSKSPSNISRSPQSHIRKPAITTNNNTNTKIDKQSSRHVNFAPFQINNPLMPQSQTAKSLKQAEQRISQLMSSITSFKNELHIKTKQVQMLRDNERLQTEQLQNERISMNRKVLMTLSEMNELEEEFKRVKKENNVLQVQVQRLKMELIRSQRARQRVDQQVIELSNKLKLSQSNKQQQTKHLKQQADRLNYQLFQTQSRIFNLQQLYKNKPNINHTPISSSAKLSQLEYQNITFVRNIRQLEDKLSDYEDKIDALERAVQEKTVQAQMLNDKLIKSEKTSMKQQSFSNSAYVLLEQKYFNTAKDLQQKTSILHNINHQHDQIIKQKDQQIQSIRNKFNSFIHKIQYQPLN